MTHLADEIEALAAKATQEKVHVTSYWHGSGPDERVFGMVVKEDDMPTGVIDEKDAAEDSLSYDLDLYVLLHNHIPEIVAALRSKSHET